MAVPFQPASIHPHSFVFYERVSGSIRFRVDAENDGSLPVEKVAGLLAMHCLVRGQSPEDYELMIVARESMLHLVAERTRELLEAGRAVGAGVKVSRREQEVLDGILQHLSNKEIAVKLQVSERTVKFHVSSLLAKFGVTDRMALTREVQLGRVPSDYNSGQTLPQILFGFPILAPPAEPNASDDSAPVEIPRRVSRDRNRVVSMERQERYAT